MDTPFTRHVRLEDEEVAKLLCGLDDGAGREPDDNRRQHERWHYRVPDVAVTITHPGGGHSRALVMARNLSVGGISFLHGGYVHPGSECSVVLMRRDGTPLAVAGTVRQCRHIASTCHEIGIQFGREIDPHIILLPDDVDLGDRAQATSGEVPSLTGEVLLVDDSESDRRLLAHQLTATGLRITPVATSGASRDALRRQPFDAVLCGLDVTGDGVYAVRGMREGGYKGPIIVFTAESTLEPLIEVREAGATEVVGKPYEPRYVMDLIAECLGQDTLDNPIASPLEGEPGMAEIVADFVEEARRLAAHVIKAAGEGDTARIRESCRRLEGSGTIHGFDQLTVAARDTLRLLDAGGELSLEGGSPRRLLNICRRLQAPANTQRKSA